MSQMTDQQASAYWKRNLSLMMKLLVVWFAVSFGCGIPHTIELTLSSLA